MWTKVKRGEPLLIAWNSWADCDTVDWVGSRDKFDELYEVISEADYPDETLEATCPK